MPIPSYILELQQLEIRAALSKLRELPSLTLSNVTHDDSCAICFLPLDTLIKEEETTETGLHFVETHGTLREQMAGVVKLDSCGHIFCRKDLAEWVESRHGTCPACRQAFFDFSHFDEDEYESSDGGEYIPDEDTDELDHFTDDDMLHRTATSDFDSEDMTSEGEDDNDHRASSPSSLESLTAPFSPTSAFQVQSHTRGETSSPRSRTSPASAVLRSAGPRGRPSRASSARDQLEESEDEEFRPDLLRRPLRHGRFRMVDPYPLPRPRVRANRQGSTSSPQQGGNAIVPTLDDSDLPTGLLGPGEAGERFTLSSDDFESPQTSDEADAHPSSASQESSGVTDRPSEVKHI